MTSELEHEVGILKAENLKLRNEVARLSQQTQHNQLQLTIPKSVADELDLINASEYENLIENFFESYNDSTLSERLDEFCILPFNFNLCILYLVSIELGVDLVKVGEGLNESKNK